MGQYFEFVNIDRREHLYTDDEVQLLVVLAGGFMEQLVELIRTPKWLPFRSSTKHLQAFKLSSTRSSVVGLPQEIIDNIVCNLSKDSSESVIYLSLTCVYFFRLLGPTFQDILQEDTAPWAGHRLIFVGDYADGLDIGGICTGDELRHFEENKEKYSRNPLYKISEDRVMCSKSMHIKPRRGPWSVEPRDLRRAGALEYRITDKLKLDELQLFHRLSAIMKRAQVCSDHRKDVPVLRVLTAKKYVRGDTIAQSNYAYSLGEVVGVLTVWSGSSSRMEDLDCVGECAGHRFDIATMADVPEEGWTDISELAIKRLSDGFGWRKRVGKGHGSVCDV